MSTPEKEPIPEAFKIWADDYVNKMDLDGHPSMKEHVQAEVSVALSAAYRHLSPQPSPGLRRVKASERLPEPETWVFLIIGYPGVDSRMDSGRLRGDRFQTRTHDYNVERQGAFIEWLEETPASQNPTCSYPNCYPEGGGEGEEKPSNIHFHCKNKKEGKVECNAQCRHCWEYYEPIDQPVGNTITAIKCTICGTPNQIYKNGNDRRRCWYCKESLDGAERIVYKLNDAWSDKSPIADGKEVPEEIREWIAKAYDDLDGHAALMINRFSWEQAALAMYHHIGRDNSVFDGMYKIKAQQLLASRNKNNDDGMEIARLLAELKGKREARRLDRIEYAKWIKGVIADELEDRDWDSLAYRLAFEFDAHVSAVYEGAGQWETRCLDAEKNLTAMIEVDLQKSKGLDNVEKERRGYRTVLEWLNENFMLMLNKDESANIGHGLIVSALNQYPSPTLTNKDNG